MYIYIYIHTYIGLIRFFNYTLTDMDPPPMISRFAAPVRSSSSGSDPATSTTTETDTGTAVAPVPPRIPTLPRPLLHRLRTCRKRC